MSQPLGKLGLITTVIGVIALLAWAEYEVGWLLTVALLSGGVGFVAGAVESVLAQRGQPLKGVGRLQGDWNAAIFPWSFVILIIGLGLLTLGMVRAFDLLPAFESFVVRRPGPTLIVGGLALGYAGVATVLGPIRRSSSLLELLGTLPARLLGVLMVAGGLAALLLGGFEVISPSEFDRWLAGLLGPFTP